MLVQAGRHHQCGDAMHIERVTAVELLPVHHIADEHFLKDKGLTNYWGYSTIGYFAPHAGYAATGRRGL